MKPVKISRTTASQLQLQDLWAAHDFAVAEIECRVSGSGETFVENVERALNVIETRGKIKTLEARIESSQRAEERRLSGMDRAQLQESIERKREAIRDMEEGIKDLRESWGDGSQEVREAQEEIITMCRKLETAENALRDAS